MTGFDLPENYHNNPESLLRRVRAKTIHGQRPVPRDLEPSISTSTPVTTMAEKTIREFSIPLSNNIPTGPEVQVGENFELKPGVIHMQFLEICSTFNMKGASLDAVKLCLFPFSLVGKAKQWFYLNRASLTSWNACSDAFLAKYFPLGKTNALRNKISSFQQLTDETVAEAWERLQEYIAACPHPGMQEWLIIQKRSSTRSCGIHQIESTDMLATKMDLRLKKLNDAPEAAPVQALDSHKACEVCGNTRHSGNSCPETQPEDANFIGNSTNGFNGNRPQPGWNSRPNLPFLWTRNNYNFDQKAMNHSISKKFHANDRMFESISLQIETLNSAMKNQLSFNKMLETQIAQLAAALPNPNAGKLPGQPDAPSKEHINAVTAMGGKSTQDPPSPSHAGKAQEKPAESKDKVTEEDTLGKEEKPASKHLPHEFYDTTVLPFPSRNKKAATDEQYSKFVEIIKKLYVNISLLDAMQVPTYAKYLKDILNNKKPLPSTEIVHLTEECSVAILKKKDPGSPTISCSIGTQHFDQALCDLGASVSVMLKVIFDKLNHDALAPTAMCLQLADQSVHYPEGVAEFSHTSRHCGTGYGD
ncbi:hypothetical protein BS78_K270700 [Paspalum vaginatum]|uniref:Retrotransposon gag domain-containing protein n=1 Tax=Paspalum vaginatum TaxID=158149 RepID=A0A9W8CF06_9POAL|nr:hypothetical protein BS78_K270700 [Paspalum vaginatum]